MPQAAQVAQPTSTLFLFLSSAALVAAFTKFLASAQQKHYELVLRYSGYTKVAHLKGASDEDLIGAHLEKPETKRLRYTSFPGHVRVIRALGAWEIVMRIKKRKRAMRLFGVALGLSKGPSTWHLAPGWNYS